MRYYIWCDESVTKGKWFSDFYGGVLVSSKDFEEVRAALTAKKDSLPELGNELKWNRINEFQMGAYFEMVDLLFKFINNNKLKIRIMFTQNIRQQTGYNEYQRTHRYHLLYYQFIKHAFGLKFLNPKEENHLELFFDKIPESEEKNELFKNHLFSLQRLKEFQDANLKISPDAIAEVDSKKHILLQCLDIVLGAMAFRLNKMHLEKPENSKRRGKKTVAKEKVYKHILSHIQANYPNFNIGVSTSKHEDIENLWKHPYRHWLFIPSKWKKIEEE